MRVVFDASVIIAAFLSPTGGSAYLLRFVRSGRIIGITSQTVIAEILAPEKPAKLHRTREDIEEFISQSKLYVRQNVTELEIRHLHGQIDPTDAHLIAGAKLTICDYLVSLDKKHVLHAEIRDKFLPLR